MPHIAARTSSLGRDVQACFCRQSCGKKRPCSKQRHPHISPPSAAFGLSKTWSRSTLCAGQSERYVETELRSSRSRRPKHHLVTYHISPARRENIALAPKWTRGWSSPHHGVANGRSPQAIRGRSILEWGAFRYMILFLFFKNRPRRRLRRRP